jgi:hypothetical protein
MPKPARNTVFELSPGANSDSEARRDLLAVVVRRGGHERNLQRLQGHVGVVLKLSSARTLEKPESSLIAQAVVDCEVMRNAPGILGVERQPLNVLREAAIAGGSVRAAYAGSRAGRGIALRGRRNIIKRQRSGDAAAVGAGRIDVAIWVGGVLDNLLRRGCKCAAQHRLMNEVDVRTSARGAGGVTQVVAKLIFVLIAQVGEKSDGRGELVIAESLEAGNRQRGRTEGKRQREAQIRVARLRKVQQAGVDDQSCRASSD